VVLAAKSLATELLTGGTRPRAALLVTRMPLTVPRLLTLQLTSKGLGTLHLLHLVPAPALLAGHVQAGGAVAPVASLRAVMAPTPQHLPTRVPTGGSGLSAGQPGGGLATGAEPVQGERARRTGARVTDEVTRVISTRQEGATRSSTLKLWGGAGAWLLSLETLT